MIFDITDKFVHQTQTRLSLEKVRKNEKNKLQLSLTLNSPLLNETKKNRTLFFYFIRSSLDCRKIGTQHLDKTMQQIPTVRHTWEL